MAEIVQYHLEKMVGELEDLERRELFSKPELKAIVKKRTKFEYALKRRRVPRAAFLRYVEYEMNVDALRQRRKSRMGQVGQKTTLSDYSIRQRIISIYERAVVRHSDDIDMWLQFIDFVKSQRAGGSQDEDAQGFTRLLGQLYARAITAHPYEAQLWILAAAHEFEANVNGTAARVLLQRAIRVNPKDKRLWIEYFRLEILLVEKIKARRRVLGIDGAEEAVAAGAEDAAEGAVAAEDANVIRLGELDEERQAAGDELRLIEERLEASALAKMAGGRKPAALSAEQRSAMAQQANAYLQGAVARVVFEQAIAAVPDDLGFREEFASIFSKFEGMEEGRRHVLESIARDFAHDAPARSYLCSAHLARANVASPAFIDALRLSVDKFAQALADIDTPEMWAKYVGFLAQWQRASVGDMASLHAYFTALLERAMGAVSENKQGRLDEALALAFAGMIEDQQALLNWLADATQRFPGSDRLWHQRLAALIAAQAEPGLSGSSGAARIERLFECEALPAVAQSKLVWDLWLGWTEQRFSAGDISADRVQARYLSAFIRAAQLGAEHEQLKAHLQCRYVSWAWGLPAHVHLRTAAEISAAGASIDDSGSDGDGDGGSDSGTGHPKARNIAAFRRAYSNVARHAFPTLGFYSRCLQLEPELKQKTLLHEMACRVSPAKQAQWLSYLRFLIENRKLDSAAAVFWRASKALRSDEDRAAFDTAYQSLLQEEAASKTS